MSKDYYSKIRAQYLDNEEPDTYCIGSKKEALDLFGSEAKFLLTEEIDQVENIKRVYVLPASKTIKNYKIPSSIEKLENLNFIDIPWPLINQIDKNFASRNLNLMVSFDNKYLRKVKQKLIKWPDFENKKIKSISFLGSDTEIISTWSNWGLSHKRVPNVEFFFSHVDKEGKILALANELKSLKHIELVYINNHDIFDILNNHFISLSANGFGRKFTVKNIIKHDKLEMVRLNGIKTEIDCELFLNMSNLYEITIRNSKKIKNVGCLLSMKNIKSLTLVNCGKVLKDKEKALFKQHGFKYLNIDYC